MNYEELRVKEMKLAEELKAVREELAKAEQTKAVNLLGVAIKSLEDVDSILLSPDCDFEVYCEECEAEFDTRVSLADVIQSLKDLREGVR
jgi:hypothetical protein